MATLVTGGGSGMGREISRVMSAHGVVGVLDQNLAGAEETVAEVEELGGRAIALEADVTSNAQMGEAVEAFIKESGHLDAVVAGAGIDVLGTILEVDEEGWDRVMAVNAKGVYLTARHTIPHMLEQGSGSFVAIASDGGVLGSQGFACYNASKHAVVGLIKCFALDYGPQGIRSNAVCPSFVYTPMSQRYLDEADDLSGAWQKTTSEERIAYWESTVPLGRLAYPDDIAGVVDFLSSGDASYINGVIYMIDGGASAEYLRL